jgi:hypothetical protein
MSIAAFPHCAKPLPDTADLDRQFFAENPHRKFLLRFASQIECAIWEDEIETRIPEDKFPYVAIMTNRVGHEPILRYRVGLRAIAIEDSEEVARKVFEGDFAWLLRKRARKADARNLNALARSCVILTGAWAAHAPRWMGERVNKT